MGTVTINGKSYVGSSIIVNDNTVMIDGKVVTSGFKEDLKVKIEGDVQLVNCDRSVIVNGAVNGNVKAHGSVTCEEVKGNVDAGGSVSCGSVGESIDAGGSVNCGTVGGDIDAGGSVNHS